MYRVKLRNIIGCQKYFLFYYFCLICFNEFHSICLSFSDLSPFNTVNFIILSPYQLSTAELNWRAWSRQMSSGQLRQVKMKVTVKTLITYCDSISSINRSKSKLPQCSIFPCGSALSEGPVEQCTCRDFLSAGGALNKRSLTFY